MKKITMVIALFLICISSYSENLKIKIEGPERSYNQIRITNNTDYSDYDCTVYLLEEKNGKFLIKEVLGIFHLKEINDTDSCTMKVKKNSYIGISYPESLGDLSYTLVYKDLPFFDVIEIALSNSKEILEDSIGKEF